MTDISRVNIIHIASTFRGKFIIVPIAVSITASLIAALFLNIYIYQTTI